MKFEKLLNNILIQEELTQIQKQLVDQYSNRRTSNDFGPIFKEQRTYFELQKKEIEELEIPENIKQAVDQAGFYIIDYRTGIAIKKDDKKDLKQIKVGKILNRLNNPELIKQFNERLGTSRKSIQRLLICITYNPYDVAGMSTDRNWTSCMDLNKGMYRLTALHQVEYGGMCAYLIKDNDKEVEQPLARIAIKRFVDKNDLSAFIFMSENRVYGDKDLAKELNFSEQVKNILIKSNDKTSKNKFEFSYENPYTTDEKGQQSDRVYSDSRFDKIYYRNKSFDITKITSDLFNDICRNNIDILSEKDLDYLCTKYPDTCFWGLVLSKKDLSEQFIEKYYKNAFMTTISERPLTEHFMRKHFNELNNGRLQIFQNFSEQFIYEYYEKLDINKLLRFNTKISNELFSKLLIRYTREHGIRQCGTTFWRDISSRGNLPNKIIERFSYILNFDEIIARQKIPFDIILQNIDNLNLDDLLKHQKFTQSELEQLCRYFRSNYVWTALSQYQKLSEYFIEKYQNKVDWNMISLYQKLSKDFIKKFKYKINFEMLHDNKYITKSQLNELANEI